MPRKERKKRERKEREDREKREASLTKRFTRLFAATNNLFMESVLKPLRERQKERGRKEGRGRGAEPVLGIPNSSKPSENSRKVPFRTSDLGHIISTVSRYSEGSRGLT